MAMMQEDFAVQRLYEFNIQIEERISRLNERIAALDRQIVVNDHQLQALADDAEFRNEMGYDSDQSELLPEMLAYDANSDSDWEHEDIPDSDDDNDDDTVVGTWDDPIRTPARRYNLYYPRYLDEGLECLEGDLTDIE
jgi:uncharacterized protein YihD (DUF1040 family)